MFVGATNLFCMCVLCSFSVNSAVLARAHYYRRRNNSISNLPLCEMCISSTGMRLRSKLKRFILWKLTNTPFYLAFIIPKEVRRAFGKRSRARDIEYVEMRFSVHSRRCRRRRSRRPHRRHQAKSMMCLLLVYLNHLQYSFTICVHFAI